MKNKFDRFNCSMENDSDMLEVCNLLCDYGKLLDLDFIIFKMFSFSTLKIEYADIIGINIIEDKILRINTEFATINIVISEILTIEIE